MGELTCLTLGFIRIDQRQQRRRPFSEKNTSNDVGERPERIANDIMAKRQRMSRRGHTCNRYFRLDKLKIRGRARMQPDVAPQTTPEHENHEKESIPELSRNMTNMKINAGPQK